MFGDRMKMPRKRFTKKLYLKSIVGYSTLKDTHTSAAIRQTTVLEKQYPLKSKFIEFTEKSDRRQKAMEMKKVTQEIKIR